MAAFFLRSAVSILASVAALGASIVAADSLPELLKRPVRGTYDSAKTALGLEHCIGSAVSDWGFPSILHGDRVTDLWSGKPYAIRIEDNGQTRRVSFTATAAYNDRVAKAIGGCL